MGKKRPGKNVCDAVFKCAMPIKSTQRLKAHKPFSAALKIMDGTARFLNYIDAFMSLLSYRKVDPLGLTYSPVKTHVSGLSRSASR